MGIRSLNKFLQTECAECISNVTFQEIKGKSIVIDISIYMFKFFPNNQLLIKMRQLLDFLSNYQIRAIFVFDGKSPIEKQETLQIRKEERERLYKEYQELKEKLSKLESLDESELENEKNQLEKLRNKIAIIRKEDFENVRMMIEEYQFLSIIAKGEADELCGYLCKSGKVWGCVSDDMDMFVYGCNNIIRNIDVEKGKFELYDFKQILLKLRLKESDFRTICILSGTDYNVDKIRPINLFLVLKLFKKYKKTKLSMDFIRWLSTEKNMDIDIELVKNIMKLFLIEDKSNVIEYMNLKIK